MNLIENLNSILWALFGVFTLVEVIVYFGFPGYRKNPRNAGMVETLDSFWVAMAVALSLKTVWVQPFTIPSGSMEDTLQVGDYILVKKYEYGYSFFNQTPRFLEFHKPQRRDVVVFMFPEDHSKDFIKRCIGTPGDVVELRNDQLYVNGDLQVEPYVKHIMTPLTALSEDGADSVKVNFGPVTVEPGHYFMMGDNRDNSYDSRYWGQLDEKLIKGRAWFIYYHSVSMASFVALGALTVGAVYLILLLLTFVEKRSASPAEEADAQAKEAARKNHLLTIAVCLVLAGVLIGVGGPQNFKDNCQTLKERMFTVIK
jgi:signal peptidase I